MISDDGASALFYALVVTAVVVLASCRRCVPARAFWKDWSVLIVAMAAVLLTVVASQAWHGQWRGAGIERASRLAFLAPFVWFFLHIDPARLRHAQWGMVVSVVVAGGLLVFPMAVSGTRPLTVEYTPYNTVSFSNLTLLFSISCLFLAFGPALTRWPMAERLVKLAAAAFGLYGFLMSQTRTGWLALPVFALIAVLLYDKVSLRARIGAVLAALVVGVAIGTTSDGLSDRVRGGFQEWEACQDNKLRHTSVCIRMQLADAALHMFRSSPVFGVGDANFRQSLRDLEQQGVVSTRVAREFGEPHNDFLYYLARYGIVGVLGLLLVYLAPAWYFVRALLKGEQASRVYAALGLSCCLGFAIFGLTELMFRGMRTIGFYSVWVGVMLAVGCDARRKTPGHPIP